MRQLYEKNGNDRESKGLSLLEEDFYLDNSDKLLFAMKEFKADFN